MLKGKLWRDGEFLKLWGGQSINELGSQVSQLALPTVAILLLGATPFQVGLLTACEFLAFPTLGLVAGVYADRLRRRPIMIACDLARMTALASVPISSRATASFRSAARWRRWRGRRWPAFSSSSLERRERWRSMPHRSWSRCCRCGGYAGPSQSLSRHLSWGAEASGRRCGRASVSFSATPPSGRSRAAPRHRTWARTFSRRST